MGRVLEICSLEVENIRDDTDFTITTGAISFRNLSFGYNEKELILDNISFDIPAQQFVALVGPSGSGKSTILSLLLTFFDNYTGDILIDGQSLRGISKVSIREQISCVFQSNYFFLGQLEKIYYMEKIRLLMFLIVVLLKF